MSGRGSHNTNRHSSSPKSRKIRSALTPTVLVIENESHKHAGHAGNPSGAADAETHFNVRVEADAFEGMKLLARHRVINDLLKEEFEKGLHALSLKLATPGEKKQ